MFVSRVINDTHKLNLTEKESAEGAKLLWVKPEEALKLISECIENLKASAYESLYLSKFVVLRDKKILEYYINNEYKN